MDSTALLDALWRAGPRLPLRVLHVCHHLRPEADDWAIHCEAAARARRLVFRRLDVAVVAAGRGIEAAARTARYRALAGILAPGEALVTAHHARDQAETFMLQALRGAGARGLAGMPESAALGAGTIWRPWRRIERGAIRDYARGRGLDWIEDPSNHDPAIARGYLRAYLWPALAARWPAAERTLARSTAWAAQAREAVDALAAIDLARVADRDGALSIAALRALSAARRAEVLRRRLAALDLDPPDHRHVAQILSLIEAREIHSPRVGYAATEVRRFDGRLFCMPRLAPPPDRALALAWSGVQPLKLPGDSGRLRLVSGAPAEYIVAFRRGGERIDTAGGRRRALKDALREARIPPWVRERMPLVYTRDRLVAVADRWRADELEHTDGFGAEPKAGGEPRPRTPVLVWSHALVGDPGRVVAPGAFG